MLGMHSETCPELVMALNNKLMVQFIRKHTTGEGSCETEVENDLKKHENLFRTGFGIEHCDVKPPGQPWFFFHKLLKVSKSEKQNTKFSHSPKNQWNFVQFFALASKSGWIKKLKALYCPK